jgi:hypothetical protein
VAYRLFFCCFGGSGLPRSGVLACNVPQAHLEQDNLKAILYEMLEKPAVFHAIIFAMLGSSMFHLISPGYFSNG